MTENRRHSAQAGEPAASLIEEKLKSRLDETYRSRWVFLSDNGIETGWPGVLDDVAEQVVRRLKPATVLDVGCGSGVLVKALRDRKVDAWGIDFSEEPLSQAVDGVRSYCQVVKPGFTLSESYDVILCVNAIEPIADNDSPVLRILTSATNHLLFAAVPTPAEATIRRKGRTTREWLDLFAVFGFAPDIGFDASFASAHAMLLHRAAPLPSAVLQLFAECIDRRYAAAQGRTETAQSSAGDSAELARYRERANILEEQLARECEHHETLRGVQAYLMQEVQTLREGIRHGSTIANSVDLETLAARLRAEMGRQEGPGDATPAEIWRLVQQQAELRAELSRLERRTNGIERSVQTLAGSVNNIVQSRIWTTLMTVGGLLLRATGRNGPTPGSIR